MSTPNTVRCLLGMLGTDIHSKGIRTLARILDDAGGVEVIYIGEHNSVDGMAEAVRESGAAIVGVSFSSSAYVEYTRRLIAAMKAAGVGHVPVMIGGMVHPDDVPELLDIGVARIFAAGSTTAEIITWVQSAGVAAMSAA